MNARRLKRVVDTMMIAAAIAFGAMGAPVTGTAASTPAPGGTPLAAVCPSSEYPAVGALGITGGAVEWVACSPIEAYRRVVGASDDIVLVEEGGPRGQSLETIALDAANGSERWRMSTANTPAPTGPVDGQGIVVLATADRNAPALVGLDALTGQERWRAASSDVPFVHSATIAIVWNWDAISNVSEGQFRAIDRVTGNELWVSDTLVSDPSQSAMAVGRSPAAVLGDTIVLPTGPTVTALDLRTGAALWTAPRIAHLHAGEDGGIVGVNGANGPPHSITLTAIDAATGERLWSAPGQPSYGGFLAVGDGVVAVLEPERRGIVAYELVSGNERWRAAFTAFAEPQMISGTSLILLWEGELAVVSTTDGTTVWSATQPFQSPLMNSVGSNGNSVFVAINSIPWSD